MPVYDRNFKVITKIDKKFNGIFMFAEISCLTTLTANEKIVLAYMACFFKEKREFFVGNKKLMLICGISLPTCTNVLRELQKKGFIEKISGSGDRRKFICTEYLRKILNSRKTPEERVI